MSQRRFSSLHNHTYYSLLDAVMSPEELVQQAYDLNFKAVSFTEHGNMHSFIEGYKKAKELGIKFIAGCEVYETTNMDYKEKDADRFHLLLLAKSDKGLKNLFKIVTEGYTRGFYTKPRIDIDLLSKYSEDIICMTACLGSRIDRLLYNGKCSCCHDANIHSECTNYEPKWNEAVEWVAKYKAVFGDNFYIEMQSHDTESSNIANQRLLQLANMTNTKYTITFDTHMKDGSDKSRDIHRRFLMVGQDREDSNNQIWDTYEGCWQTDIEGIHQVMDKQIGFDAVEIGINTSDEISEQCNIEIKLHQNLMPKIDLPDGFSTEQDYLKHLVRVGWKERGLHKLSKEKQAIYKERVQKEFEVLDYLGYCGYFIMLQMLLSKVKEREIPKGYSRGSGANCLILYVIGVTEVDSIRWDLDFSRFANKGRVGSVADYDIDISQVRREEVIDIAIELFGEENVAQLATFNSLTPKVCIRDLGKVFDEEGIYSIPYAMRDKIAKLIPDDPNEKMTIERALEASSELRGYAEEYPLLFEYTKSLQNLPKSVGCHAAAVIISPNPAIEYAPLMQNKRGNIMMQLEMHNAMDDIGLCKMDFLGLVTTDVVDNAIKLAGLTWDDIDLNKLDLDDKEVFEHIYASANAFGVFQMEAYIAQEMFKQMKADTIYDVFAVNAMNRPAVLAVGMDKEYIRNKLDRENIKYIHNDLEPIMRETYGVMLYQEQALKVFELAGFPEDERDTARRAIGKKKKDVMESLYAKFADGLKMRNWSDSQISEIWKLIEAQAGYSFNLGHSSSYGLLSYVTAWLKYHYPIQFMTALLISEIGDYSQTSKYISECNKMGIKISPPDINLSEKIYTIHEDKILFGLEAIKGVGEKAVLSLIEEIATNGMFESFENFYERLRSNSLISSSVIVALIKSGCFGSNKDDLLLKFATLEFGTSEFKPVKSLPTKKILFELGIIETEDEFKEKEKCLAKYNCYKESEFNKLRNEKYTKHINEFKEKEMDSSEMYEYDTLSIFIDGNPFDRYVSYFKPFEDCDDNTTVAAIGTITSVKKKKQKNGKPYAYIELLTPTGSMIEGVIFNSQYSEYQDIIKRGSNVIISATKNGGQFRTEKMWTLEQWIERTYKHFDRLTVNCYYNHRGDTGMWGAALAYKDKVKELSKKETGITENAISLLACINALKGIKTTDIPVDVIINSDYVCGVMNNRHSKKADDNKDLWLELIELASKQQDIRFIKENKQQGE